ncbi:N-6 DNA methylase [Clostridium sp.]|uniref:N-6 DNA methylase n=1 Tax=Clostridium sp. TaxID=1506 RepID=UPI002E76A035|nr:N-6 DNA methylase [Clostridium sp.]MEE0567511.1 N-6 DNA methylase [Clostridium sp.]
MSITFSYSIFYKILLNLREDFHSYGRIDDSNVKLDEIIKLICINFSLAKKGCKFNLAYVKSKAYELFENEEDLAKALRYIFEEEAKMSMFYNNDNTNIFGANISLNIQPTENEFAEKLIGEIEKIDFINLLKNSKYEDFDLVNECFGHFVRENFRNNKEDAQYMTPYEIVAPVVEIIFNDMEKDGYLTKERIRNFTVMDPSCGVGTLLIECSNYFTRFIEKQCLEPSDRETIVSKFRENGVIGQDKVDRMVRLSKINMLLLGGNMSNILNGNSIVGSSKLSDYKGNVDLIFTNPPFGAEYTTDKLEIDDYPILKELNLSTTIVSSELLMLDKCINMLNDYGYLAIVLPDSFFSAKGLNEIYRNSILKYTDVRCIIELPDVTFAQAGTRTKTSILYLRKKSDNNRDSIFMANCDEIGYIVKERIGVPVKISKGINKMPIIAKSIINSENISEGIISVNPSVTTVSKDQLIDNVLKAGFYSADRFEYINSIKNIKLDGFEIKKLSEVVDFVTSKRKLCKVDSKIKHVSVLHVNSDCTIDFREVEKYKPLSKGRMCEPGDIIFSKINPRIQRIAIIPNSKYELSCSQEFEIMRPKKDMDIYTLSFLLRTKSVMVQIENLTSGTSSSHCRIRREQLANITIPVPVTNEAIDKFKNINKNLKETVEIRYRADKIMIKEMKYLESIF